MATSAQTALKGQLTLITRNRSSFTRPRVVTNLCEFFLLLNKKEDILKNVGDQTSD